MKKLVIAEKTSAAKILAKGLREHFEFVEGNKKFKPPEPKCGYFESDNTIITYVRGHLLRTKTIEEYTNSPASPRRYDILPYMPQKFELLPTEGTWAKEQLDVIKQLINRKDVDVIVHYGDPDNEGELIIREVLSYLGNKKPIKRLWCNSPVPEVVAEAYYDLRDISEFNDKYLMALARQQFDWFYGINVSRYLTSKAKKNFPAGRILIPITKFIYDRDMAIKNFVVENYFGITGEIKKGDWKGIISNSKPEIKFEANEENLCNNLCNKLNNAEKTVIEANSNIKKIRPKLLFNLNSFLTMLNKKYKVSLKDGNACLQSLYEHGFVTYPRTPTEYLSSKEEKEMERIITSLKKCGYPVEFKKTKNVFDDKKCTGGHSALTITSKIPTKDEFDKMSDYEKQGYMLIFNRTLSNFATEETKVETTTVKISVDEYIYTLTGDRLLSKGFTVFEERKIKDEIPEFVVGEKLDIKFETQKRKTSPPSRVDPEQLLAFLENPNADVLKTINKEDNEEYYELLKTGATLGTEATISIIVENAKKYDYIKQVKNSYYITEKGICFIELLNQLDINLFKDKNIEMNKAIRKIGNKMLLLETYRKEMKSELEETFNSNKQININFNLAENDYIGKCPVCGGAVVEKTNSFQCVEKCGFYLYKEDAYFKSLGKKITKTMAKSLLNNGRVTLKGITSHKTGNKYDAIINADFTNMKNGGRASYKLSFPEKSSRKK